MLHRFAADFGHGVEELEADRHGELLRSVEVDEGPEEVAPTCDDGDDGKCSEHWFAEGHQNGPEDTEVAGSIDQGCFIQVSGQGQEELTHQEDGECAAAEPVGHPKGKVRVDPSQPVEEDELRDEGDLGGEHHGRERDHEEDIPSAIFEAGKGVGNEGGGDQGAQGGEYHDHDGVDKPLAHRVVDIEDGPVVGPLRDGGDQDGREGEHFRNRFERTHHGPEEGEAKEDAEDEDDQIGYPAVEKMHGALRGYGSTLQKGILGHCSLCHRAIA